MATSLNTLFTPADFSELRCRDLRQTVCVVFDVLRATSSMLTALANGATQIIPVAEIPEALAERTRHPGALLAGEREGVRIGAQLSGGAEFDLGNSPREFSADKVSGKTIIMTTTNGTRALQACAPARSTLVGSFLNLCALEQHLRQSVPRELILVCSGTFEQAAYEDVLAAGALADRVWPWYADGEMTDSSHLARQIFQGARGDFQAAMTFSRNARRLLSIPDLRDDVAVCLSLDSIPFVAGLNVDGAVRRIEKSTR